MADEFFPFDALRQVLATKVLDAAGTVTDIVGIEMPNDPWIAPKHSNYASFWYKTGGSKKIDNGMGGSHQTMTVGLIQIDVLVPEKIGDGVVTRIADKFRKKFDNKQWIVAPFGYVTLLSANVKTPFSGAKDGYYRACMDVVFHYYFHESPE